MEKINQVIKGGIIGDSLLLPYEFLKKNKAQNKYFKYGLKQSLFAGYGFTSDDSDHLIMTYQAIKNTSNVRDFQNLLAKKLKHWFFTFPIGIGLTTIKSIFKLLLGFSPQKSGINSLGNGSLMRVSVIATYFYNNEDKRNEYIKTATEITHNNIETIKITQLIGNVIAHIVKNERKPIEKEYKEILKCENQLTNKYINIFLNNLNADLDSYLKQAESSKQVTGYIMTSSIFILYILHNAKNYKEAFEMIIQASGDTDTIGAVVGSLFAVLDKNMLEDKEINKILLTDINNSDNYKYLNMLLKNIVSIPIILTHGILRWIK